MSFIEETFQLPELCMGVRPHDNLPEKLNIRANSHRGVDGKFYFSAQSGDTSATGNTELDAITALRILKAKNR